MTEQKNGPDLTTQLAFWCGIVGAATSLALGLWLWFGLDRPALAAAPLLLAVICLTGSPAATRRAGLPTQRR